LQNKSQQLGAENMQIGGQPFDTYSADEILTILNTIDIANYDVIVAESAYSPTARISTFMLLNEMAQSGTPIPPELMVEFMDIPSELKQKIQGGLQAQSASQQSMQDATAKMEINKTLIAKGIIPPEVREQLGGQGQQPSPGQQVPTEGTGIGLQS
jgi:hypothetical protein